MKQDYYLCFQIQQGGRCIGGLRKNLEKLLKSEKI